MALLGLSHVGPVACVNSTLWLKQTTCNCKGLEEVSAYLCGCDWRPDASEGVSVEAPDVVASLQMLRLRHASPKRLDE